MIPDGIHIVRTTVHGFRFLVLYVDCATVRAASARSDKKQAMALAADWQKLHRRAIIRDHTPTERESRRELLAQAEDWQERTGGGRW